MDFAIWACIKQKYRKPIINMLDNTNIFLIKKQSLCAGQQKAIKTGAALLLGKIADSLY
jgi:hypothetical protein